MSVHSKNNEEFETYLRKEEAVRVWLEHAVGASFPHDYVPLLKDGIILCTVLRAFDEASVPSFRSGPDLPFFQMKNNINFFLAACRELFDFKKSDLFDIYDLVHLRCVVRVVGLLYRVACLVSQHPNWVGASLATVTPEALEVHKAERGGLKEVALQLRQLEDAAAMKTPRGATGPRGAALLNRPRVAFKVSQLTAAQRRKVTAPITRFQAHVRGCLARKKVAKMLRKEAYRTKIANEMLDTERKYSTGLSILVDDFLMPMRKRADDLRVDVQQVHLNANIIVTFSQEVLQAIEPRVSAWSPSQRIGDVFVDTAHFFKVYTNYVQAYTTILGQLTKQREVNGKLNEFLAEIENSATTLAKAGGTYLPFESYLILPIQRLPRYEMLLKDMFKHTEEKHTDHASLQEALELLKVVCKQINECQREFEAFNKMMEVKTMFGEQLEAEGTGIVKFVRFTRKFLMESVVWVGSRKGKKKHLFLFNDLLISGFPKDRKRAKFTLDGVYRVRFTTLETHECKAEDEFGLRLLGAGGPEDILLDLVTHSEVEQKKWVDTFMQAHEELKGTDPNDDEVSRDMMPSVWVAALEDADVRWTKPSVPAEILLAMGKAGAIPSPPTKVEAAPEKATPPALAVTPVSKAKNKSKRRSMFDLGKKKKEKSPTSSKLKQDSSEGSSETPTKSKRLSLMGFRKSNKTKSEGKSAPSKLQAASRGHRRSVSSDHRADVTTTEGKSKKTPVSLAMASEHKRSCSTDNLLSASTEDAHASMLSEIDDLLDS